MWKAMGDTAARVCDILTALGAEPVLLDLDTDEQVFIGPPVMEPCLLRVADTWLGVQVTVCPETGTGKAYMVKEPARILDIIAGSP